MEMDFDEDTADDGEEHRGLAGCGCSGKFSIDVDCSTKSSKWSLQILSQHFDIVLDLPGPQIIRSIVEYFDDTVRTNKYRDEYLGAGVYAYMPEKSVMLGLLWGQKVLIKKNGECDSCYSICCRREDCPGIFEIQLDHDDIDDFVDAVKQVDKDLQEYYEE